MERLNQTTSGSEYSAHCFIHGTRIRYFAITGVVSHFYTKPHAELPQNSANAEYP
jgi:hypothetical protein